MTAYQRMRRINRVRMVVATDTPDLHKLFGRRFLFGIRSRIAVWLTGGELATLALMEVYVRTLRADAERELEALVKEGEDG